MSGDSVAPNSAERFGENVSFLTPTGATSIISTGTGTAHAKAILFGEHAVVYGAPAITIPLHELESKVRVQTFETGVRIESELFSGDIQAAPAQLGPVVSALRASLAHAGAADSSVRVQILSAIPHSRGLGSSAAVSAAIARAVAVWAGITLDTSELFDLVQVSEKVAHGNPSGLDARAVTSNDTFRFELGAVTPLHVGAPLHFVLADSGIAGSTAQAVTGVRLRREQDPLTMNAYIAELADIAESSVADIAEGNKAAIGSKLSAAHNLLDRIGVSSEPLNHLVQAANQAGALGSKLTGGGLGGCILALAGSEEHAEELASSIRMSGAARTWTTTVAPS